MRDVINAAIIQHGEILLVEKAHKDWILPGGKIKTADVINQLYRPNHLRCLEREFREELPATILDTRDAQRYTDVFGVSPSGKNTHAIIYTGIKIVTLGTPAAEITDYAWVSPEELRNYKISDITTQGIQSLMNRNLF